MSNYRVIFSDEIYHFRTPNSKNGIRRYQNKDGTWTELGKERRRIGSGVLDITSLGNKSSKDTNRLTKADRKQKRKDTFDYWTTKTEKNGKDKPKVSPAQSVTKDVGNAIEEVKGIRRSLDKRATIESYKRAELLTDDEIRARINRMNLERQFVNLETERIDAGKITAEDILTTVGSVVAIAGATAGVIGTFKGLASAAVKDSN